MTPKKKYEYKEYHKKWYLENRERILANQKEYNKNNKEKKREYYLKNKDRLLVKRKKWEEANKERMSDYYSEYYQKEGNKKRKAEMAKARRPILRLYTRKRRQENPQVKCAVKLRNTLSKTIRAYGSINTDKVVEPIGCTPSFLITYIKNQFSEGMSWENRGEWHIDHIQPLFMFDLTDEEQYRKVSHYTNLRPLWAKEHMMIRTSKYKECNPLDENV